MVVFLYLTTIPLPVENAPNKKQNRPFMYFRCHIFVTQSFIQIHLTPILEKSQERDLHEAEHVDWYDLVGVTPGMPLISLLGHAAAVGPQGESCQTLKYIEKNSIGITAHRIRFNT